MRALDFSPLFRSTVGFDRLAAMLDAANRLDDGAPAYPPYNIQKLGEDAYRISMAVAGFDRDDLKVEIHNNTLTIAGRHVDQEGEHDAEYLHRGIAARAFERRFQLADHVKITGAELKNGLLHVDLAQEVPEAMKPRQIEIRSDASEQNVIEGHA